MTRFQQEISGALGQWWKEQAEKELEDAIRKADADAIVEPDGAIKWVKSGNYLMDDFCEMLEYAGYPFSRESTAKSRDIQNSKFIEEYKKNFHKLEKYGTQPWITNGFINMSHMFSTYGCAGYVEADEILKFKFNHCDFDYMKDFLVYFNRECARIGEREKMIWNIEAVPFEGGSPKAAKANKLLFADENGYYVID